MSANGVVTAVVEAERRRRGLTRSQLAELLGVNAMYVSRKLNGLQRWNMDDLDRISERLELPLPVLLMTPVGPVVTLQCLLDGFVTRAPNRGDDQGRKSGAGPWPTITGGRQQPGELVPVAPLTRGTGIAPRMDAGPAVTVERTHWVWVVTYGYRTLNIPTLRTA